MQFKSHTILASISMSIGLFTAASAHAALVASPDGQTIYDTDLNIT